LIFQKNFSIINVEKKEKERKNMDKKVTKREFYEMLKGIAEGAGKTELVEFVEKQIASLDSKAEKAKERNAEKKAAGDELREVVQSVLTNDYQTIDAIVAQIEGEDITKAKITARLTSLCKNGIAEKTDVKDDEGRKLKAYRLITE
jgi:hypothetical protein